MAALLDVDVRLKRFGDRPVLADLRLQLAAGEVVTLVGASGCGKSTLLRLIAGLDRAFDGEIRVLGQRLGGPTRDIRFVFQEPRLFPWLDVANNVAFDRDDGVGIQARDDPRVTELLRDVGLAGLAASWPKHLSGGQAQRVAMARGLFARPPLLLLDEPFSAVDAFTRIKLQDLLLRLAHDRGITVLMVTHDVDEAVHVSDRVLVMAADPGSVRADLRVDLPRPRDRSHAAAPALARAVREALHAVHAF